MVCVYHILEIRSPSYFCLLSVSTTFASGRPLKMGCGQNASFWGFPLVLHHLSYLSYLQEVHEDI